MNAFIVVLNELHNCSRTLLSIFIILGITFLWLIYLLQVWTLNNILIPQALVATILLYSLWIWLFKIPPVCDIIQNLLFSYLIKCNVLSLPHCCKWWICKKNSLDSWFHRKSTQRKSKQLGQLIHLYMMCCGT